MISGQLTLFHAPRVAPIDKREWTNRCVDCARDPEFYMVTEEVWAAGGLHPLGGYLCVQCLERRVGRLLVARDFPAHLPINVDARVRGELPT